MIKAARKSILAAHKCKTVLYAEQKELVTFLRGTANQTPICHALNDQQEILRILSSPIF